MNEDILQRFNEYATHPAVRSPVAAAVLTLADVLYREPIVVESDDKGTVGVKEAAELLHTSSKQVYLACLAGKLHCTCVKGRVRIPIDEIDRCQETRACPALVPRCPQ